MISALVFLIVFVGCSALAFGVWSYFAQGHIAESYEREGQPVAIGGGSLNVIDIGPRIAEGVPIVLVHGAAQNLLDLKVSLGDRLARDSRVVLIDRPGHGWSDRIDRDDIATPEGQAVALNDVLSELGVERPLLVGHGWGGALALSYALSYPENVGGVAAISPVSHPWPPGVSRIYRIAASRVFGWLFTMLIVPTFGPIFLNQSLRRSFSPQAVPGDYVDAVAGSLVLRPKNFRANARDAVALDTFLVDQATYYGQISVPVVIVSGDKDRVVPRSIHAEALANEIPGARLVVLADVGHMAHHVSPNVIVFEINRLAERIAPRPVQDMRSGAPSTDRQVQ